MALNEPELEHLLNFAGYGRLDAPAWFLEMEGRAAGLRQAVLKRAFEGKLVNGL